MRCHREGGAGLGAGGRGPGWGPGWALLVQARLGSGEFSVYSEGIPKGFSVWIEREGRGGESVSFLLIDSRC